MRILITTQAIDKDDPILGFFHGWVAALAQHFESIEVICLREGVHVLPPNVHVHSLGKESGESRVKYIFRFYRFVWRLRNAHDVVFSHMNPHYIVLAGWFWKIYKKQMFFWRNHAKMNFMTRVAARFAEKVFYTSPYACTRIFPHAVQMPVGIDTRVFTPQSTVPRRERSILSLGRISPVKHLEHFIGAGLLLEHFDMHVYGDASKGQDAYRASLEERGRGRIQFHPAIPNYETPAIYSVFDVYVNLTPEGSMDKTVLEAAACGALPVVANTSFRGILPDVCILDEVTPESLARRIQEIGNLPADEKRRYREEMRANVERDHSLQRLVKEFAQQFSAIR